MSRRIAIIGSGISGLVSAYLLSEKFEVSLFEANNYVGGHTNTVSVEIADERYALDTGFIVFNKKTYPNFCKLLEKLNVPIQLSEMSFSYRSMSSGFEYNGHNLNTLFSDRSNIFRPSFYRFIKEIISFNNDAKKFLAQSSDKKMSMEEFLGHHEYSSQFTECYLLPMLSAIWSKSKEDTLSCSAQFACTFCENHGLLDLYNRPPWYVIAQGSSSYIQPMLEKIKDRVYLNTKIESIERNKNYVVLKSKCNEFKFDCVVIATHSNQALKLLSEPSIDEHKLLSAIKYTDNKVVLHTDEHIMPRKKLSWASWNYLDDGRSPPALTYYMNRLQSIQSPTNFFVSLNLSESIDKNKIIQHFNYEHPCFDLPALDAQQQKNLINGLNNTYYVGSYWGYGFHEDGVKSAMDTCELIKGFDV
ncbi:MAG: FAD-dependent oxidoreductase [Legionella sp.]|nr:FAD-dependent oxidoreductase [Legionella sp.]